MSIPKFERPIMPETEPGRRTRGDWAYLGAYAYMQELVEEVEGAGVHFGILAYDGRTPPEPQDFETIRLPKQSYEQMKAKADAYTELVKVTEFALELAHNRDMARIAVLEIISKASSLYERKRR